jgi:uncharacterized membrane protein
MYAFDDRETAKLGDRLIAAVMAAALGLLIGSHLAAGAVALFDDRYGAQWQTRAA